MSLVTKSTFGRALGAAVLLALAAVPAVQAFEFAGGRGSGLFENRGRIGTRLCLLTDSSLRSLLASQGYTNIYLTHDNRGIRESDATKDGWVYLLTIRSCTGEILAVRRLRKA